MGHIRCAIYTRKSSEEGLEQSFNSLDAQREACEAYIRSQRHEGWHAIGAHYDDGGFSGGNVERPALKRLMADIDAGKVNTVVVYKVDRLTRSLADFAKIIERFDGREVSFVSVTQQFNTTSSMGRLTLNVLLSFAQFEREVTGERIRDKIAASKKKGMWMGGNVPLGYEVRDRKLAVNKEEADRVRLIFQNFLEQKSVMALRDWLSKNDMRSKGGKEFFRGPLYHMLRNPLYIGRIRHKSDTHLGQHEAIVDQETWDKVQALLTENRQGERRKSRATKTSLLTGIICDAGGNRYTPTHSCKSGRRYRYYTSQAVIRKAATANVATRIPAHDLEAAVAGRMLQFLNSPQELLRSLAPPGKRSETGQYAALLETAAAKAAAWTKTSTQQRESFIQAILERVVIHSDSIEMEIRTKVLFQELSGRQVSQQFCGAEVVSLSCAYRYYARGKALRLVIEGSQAPPATNSMTILKAIARVRFWRDQLIAGEAKDVVDLAQKHGVTPRYVRSLFGLASLSPESIELIINQQNKPHLSLDQLCSQIPIDWREQKQLFNQNNLIRA